MDAQYIVAPEILDSNKKMDKQPLTEKDILEIASSLLGCSCQDKRSLESIIKELFLNEQLNSRKKLALTIYHLLETDPNGQEALYLGFLSAFQNEIENYKNEDYNLYNTLLGAEKYFESRSPKSFRQVGGTNFFRKFFHY